MTLSALCNRRLHYLGRKITQRRKKKLKIKKKSNITKMSIVDWIKSIKSHAIHQQCGHPLLFFVFFLLFMSSQITCIVMASVLAQFYLYSYCSGYHLPILYHKVKESLTLGQYSGFMIHCFHEICIWRDIEPKMLRDWMMVLFISLFLSLSPSVSFFSQKSRLSWPFLSTTKEATKTLTTTPPLQPSLPPEKKKKVYKSKKK